MIFSKENVKAFVYNLEKRENKKLSPFQHHCQAKNTNLVPFNSEDK
jgi:hypothetical protein